MFFLSPPVGLIINTLIYLPLTIWLLTVPYTGHSREGAAPARRAPRWADAVEIIREGSGNRPIITMVVLAGCVSFFVGTAFQATMPEFAHDLGTEKADFAYSALLGANAPGPSRSRERPLSLQRAARRHRCRRGPRRVSARSTRLAAAAGADGDDQRDPMVRRDHLFCALDELLSFPGAALHGRHPQFDFLFHG